MPSSRTGIKRKGATYHEFPREYVAKGKRKALAFYN
jgi:hypothetical protein